MKKLLWISFLICGAFAFISDAFARTYYEPLSTMLSQRVHSKAIELEICATSCEEPQKTYSRNAVNALVAQFKDVF